MPDKISLLIADDHEIFRDGLALMLSKQKHLQLAGQAANGRELIEKTASLNPDIILTDIKMPLMDGVEATRQILKGEPHRKIIALSMFDEENLIVDMLEAGAKGYLLKNADKLEILEAIQTVNENNNYYCRLTSARLASMIVKSRFSDAKKTKPAEFNDRELEIIRYICKQHTAQEIAEKLFLSKRTVEGYRTKILEKMNVKNTAGVVIYAMKYEMVDENEL
ncbi:MAG: response regulator transcription factor [Chitinophagaceae bacterium]|nr:response regulator transcription factor [Chitinophagaceae bacterium]